FSMQVRSLQGYLRSLKAPLAGVGCPDKALQDIEQTCTALEAFADLEVGQLVPLLQMTEEYRLTGILPDLRDPLRPLVRCLARPETPVEESKAAADSIELKKGKVEQLRNFGLRLDPGFPPSSKTDKKVVLADVQQAFQERRDPATAQQQRLERLRPLI